MGVPIIFSGNNAKTLKPNIDLFGNVTINSGALDPTSSAVSANLGSLYLSTSTGLIYQKLDNGSSTNWVVLGQGSNVSDWVAYTPTFTSLGIVSNPSMFWRRIGDSIQIKGQFTTGTVAAASVQISLPNSHTADSAKQGSAIEVLGPLEANDNLNIQFSRYIVAIQGAGYISITRRYSGSSDTPLTLEDANLILNNTTVYSFGPVTVPITGWTSATAVTRTVPLVTPLTSGSGTHTLTGSPLYIRVRAFGPGGGGGGSGSSGATAGSPGSADTTFGTSLIVCGLGSGGGAGPNGTGGSGGSASLGSGPVGTAAPGGKGGGSSYAGSASIGLGGGMGASSPIGGAGAGSEGNSGNNGGDAVANSGSGGGGAGTDQSTVSGGGGGGGAGGFVDALIYSPAASYNYVIGAGGAGGGAGVNGHAGGAGGSGYIEVTEYYQ